MKNIIVYSHEPDNLGVFNIDCEEFMFVQYLPVAMPTKYCDNRIVKLPNNLKCFSGMLSRISWTWDDYVYLTVKRMWVEKGSNCNRPGWHIDGYGSDDINYIWSDSYPTEFCVNQEFNLSNNHELSLMQMNDQAQSENIKTYPVKSLLRLDNKIVHRPPEITSSGYRTFVKISVSKDIYNLKGNAHNYLFDYKWNMVDRQISRNHPVAK